MSKKYNYYNCDKLVSYNFDYNIITGGRSNGKSTEIQKKVVLKNWMDHGDKFIRIVRWVEDTYPSRCEGWFTPHALSVLPKNKEIRYKSKKYYIGDKKDKDFFKNATVIGYVINLSKANNYKSNNFEDVKNIIFEEFAPNKVTEYVPNEIDEFNSLISTVNRLRDDVKVWMIGNALSISNIYFDYFGIEASRLKVGNIYSYSATDEYEEPATVGLEFVKMSYQKEDDIPKLLRVSNNLQATKLEEYALPSEVIKGDDWLIKVLDADRFNDFYRVRCILKCSIDDSDNLKRNYKFKFVEYAIIEEKSNPKNIYIVNVTEKLLEYGVVLDVVKQYYKYKFDNDIRNTLKMFDTSYFRGKRVVFGDLNIIKIYSEVVGIVKN